MVLKYSFGHINDSSSLIGNVRLIIMVNFELVRVTLLSSPKGGHKIEAEPIKISKQNLTGSNFDISTMCPCK